MVLVRWIGRSSASSAAPPTKTALAAPRSRRRRELGENRQPPYLMSYSFAIKSQAHRAQNRIAIPKLAPLLPFRR